MVVCVWQVWMNIYIYIYINKYICIYIYIYIHMLSRAAVVPKAPTVMHGGVGVAGMGVCVCIICRGLAVCQCNTLQHIATYWNTLQHTAPHWNTLQHTAAQCVSYAGVLQCVTALQHTATHRNTLQHTATHRAATQCVSYGVLNRRRHVVGSLKWHFFCKRAL